MMRHFRFDKLSKKFVVETCSIPSKPFEEAVLLKVKGFAVNRADLLQKKGLYPPPKNAPDFLGLEVLGEIQESSSFISSYPKNTLFGTIVPGGGYAEYVWAHQRHLIPFTSSLESTNGPKSCIDLREMAGLAEVFLTAWQLIRYGNIYNRFENKSEPAVVYLPAGASGVGTSLIQIIKKLWPHVKVFTTVSTESKAEACKQLGADYVVNYKQQGYESLKKLIMQVTDNKGVDAVLDCLGPGQSSFTLDIMRPEAVWVVYGLLAGSQQADPSFLRSLFLKKITLVNTLLRNRSDEYKAELVSSFNQRVLPNVLNGNIRPVVHQSRNVNFENPESAVSAITELHSIMEENANIGKLVVLLE